MENSAKKVWQAIRQHHQEKAAMQQRQLADYESLEWNDQYGLIQLQIKHMCELMELQNSFLLKLTELNRDIT